MRHVICLILTSSVTFCAEELPLGHADFYPSPERPVGWQGGGSGIWPGTTAISRNWNEHTSENVVWRTRMPGRSFSAPIVVGDLAFALASPASLLCIDARSGEILTSSATSGSGWPTVACEPERRVCWQYSAMNRDAPRSSTS